MLGVFGASLNTPGDTIRTVIQKKLLNEMIIGGEVSSGVSFVSVGREIYAARGLAGLYAGFKFKAFHLGGGGALMAVLLPFFRKIFSKSNSNKRQEELLASSYISDSVPLKHRINLK
jgi:solute carrier family 25 2-oxodicarboxylate transporter 21